MMIILDGPDRSGKTNIGTALAQKINHTYYKNKAEWSADLRDEHFFKNVLVFGGVLFNDFICAVKPNVIIDRCYPSEWVYSRVFGRATDSSALEMIDRDYAAAGGVIILCRRRSYAGLCDDLHTYVDSKKLEQIDAAYQEFSTWTKCPVLNLWVDDEDLSREIHEILNFIGV